MLLRKELNDLTELRNVLEKLNNSQLSGYVIKLDSIIQRETQKKKICSEKSNAYNKSHKEKHREQSLKCYYKKKNDKVTNNDNNRTSD